MISPTQTDTLARELLAAQAGATAIAPLSARIPGFGVDDAYAVQQRGRALRLAAGARLAGHKIGLTSLAMQELLGVAEPDFGYLTVEMLRPSGATIDRGTLIAPRVEAEIALRLSRPLQGADVGRAEALAAIVEVAPALEIVDSRVRDWQITIADTVADNASSGLAVLGDFAPADGLDLAAVEMEMTVTASDGSAARERGAGAAVLGHPAEALAWLVRCLARYGAGVAAGEVVIPGAMARAITLDGPAEVHARFSGLGSVTAHLGPL